jgi:hypothetical protein
MEHRRKKKEMIAVLQQKSRTEVTMLTDLVADKRRSILSSSLAIRGKNLDAFSSSHSIN